jgi:tetratricopeptide (TPR) repeat protein
MRSDRMRAGPTDITSEALRNCLARFLPAAILLGSVGPFERLCQGAIVQSRQELLDETRQRLELHGQLAPRSDAQRELVESLDFLRRQLQRDPHNVELRWLKGLCHLELDDHESAIRELEFVLAHQPIPPEAPETLALAYNNKAYLLEREHRDLPQALGLIERAIALDPGESLYLITKADVLYRLGRYADALRCLQRAQRDYPRHHRVLAGLARIKEAMARSVKRP